LRLKKKSTATSLLLLCAFMAAYRVNFPFLYLFHIFILYAYKIFTIFMLDPLH
jgi:hypothetical protein